MDKVININDNIKLSDNKFKIKIDREDIPMFINILLNKNIKIYSIYEEKLSLEDAFLKRTGGNKID